MHQRLIEKKVKEALTDTRVVLISGPRRAGKSTLAKGLAGNRAYVTLDDDAVLRAAQDDPDGFIRSFDKAVIDEVQRAPRLLLAIKKSVDEDPRPGRFLLTGSSDVRALPQALDSLAGRIEEHTLLPLSQAEIRGARGSFLDELFRDDAGYKPAAPADLVRGEAMVRIVCRGGFPEVLARPSENRQREWFRSYVDSLIARDFLEVSNIRLPAKMNQFTRIIAAHSGNMINASEMGRDLNTDYKTTQHYLDVLKKTFFLQTLDPWFNNEIKRIVKSPKAHLVDSGVLCYLKNLTPASISKNRAPLGAVLESFVLSEIMKLIHSGDDRIEPYHFRTHDGSEVDIVLVNSQGDMVGVEVKASSVVEKRDFKGLNILKETHGKMFRRGVVLYDGEHSLSFGEGMWAMPLSCLWN